MVTRAQQEEYATFSISRLAPMLDIDMTAEQARALCTKHRSRLCRRQGSSLKNAAVLTASQAVWHARMVSLESEDQEALVHAFHAGERTAEALALYAEIHGRDGDAAKYEALEQNALWREFDDML